MTDRADDPAPQVSERRSHRTQAIAAGAAIGLVALWLGTSQFMAGFYLGPLDDTLRDLAVDRKVSESLLKKTAAGREAAFAWYRSGSVLSDLAVLKMSAVAGTRVPSPERRRLVEAAIDLQARALTLSPADPYAWVRLAQAQALAAVPAAQVEKTLVMGLKYAPNEPGLVLARLRVGLLYWRGLGTAARDLLSRQMIVAARWMPGELVRLARARLLENDVAARLGADPVALARFNYVRARLPVPR